jgi:beta-lactam-binding protein with PASTA domain
MGVVGYLVAALVLFPSPLRTNEREMPHLVGLEEQDAREDAARLGLVVDTVVREPHPLAAVNTVVWQDPPPAVRVPRDFRVRLAVSSGLPMVRVPNLRGFDAAFAQKLLVAAGLGVDNIDSIDDISRWPEGVSVPPGTVSGTAPAAGDSVPIGLRVLLHVTR